MERGDAGTRQRTTSIPTKPESGLAEWTSRIKAMQKQVDDDEEAETRRLEEEIAASRMARMRRSTGRGMSTDLSNTDVAKSLKDNSPGAPSPGAGTTTFSGDKQRNQEDTLRKLMGESQGRRSGAAPASSGAAPVSLAAFIGGRATGPRLNKQAPQQDAHDPTQFEQRTITAPHPVFGRGGVAMPGMASRRRPGNEADSSPSARSTPSAPKEPSLAPSFNGTSAVKARAQEVDVRRTSSSEKLAGLSPTSDWQNARSRTMNTPALPVKSPSPAPVKESPSPAVRPPASSRPPSYNPVAGDYLSSKPAFSSASSGKLTPTSQPSRSTPPRTHSVSPLPSTPPYRQTSSPSIGSPKSPTFGNNPGLAKPIQPMPKKSLQGPQIPLGQNGSLAFLRPPPAKDPTPSISRLQGRGFVQNMVRSNGQQQESVPASAFPSANATPEKDRDTPRKASVLDRWQFNNSPAPIIAPKPVPLKKSRTVDSSSTPVSTSPVPTPFNPAAAKRDTSERSLKSRTSLPSLAHAAASDAVARPASAKNDIPDASPPISQRRGLGSSMTMISYIKPLKTGDNPPTNGPPSRPASRASRSRPTTPSPDVDEMGLRVRSRSRPRSVGFTEDVEVIPAGFSAGGASGKPLSHPTKDRARKPKRAKTIVAASVVKSRTSVADAVSSERRAQISAHTTPLTQSPHRTETSRLSAAPETPATRMSDIAPGHESRKSTPSPPSTGTSRRVHFPLQVEPAAAAIPQEHDKPPRSPATPIKHTRIPSTGNRATVMDVAQALSEHEEKFGRGAGDDASVEPSIEQQPAETSEAVPTNWDTGPGNATLASADKRKSSYEKYSAFVMPPLVEERTPATSPANTLARHSEVLTALKEEAVPPSTESLELLERSAIISHPGPPATSPIPSRIGESKPDVRAADPYLYVEHVDEPLPKVDIVPLLNLTPSVYKPDPDATPISVDVMSIIGSSAIPVNSDSHVFYDAETLAVVHRFKAKSSGLVNTKIWAWRGSKAHTGEREEAKLQEIARRYNTPLVNVCQNVESADMVHALGGQLAIRQGTRAHWSRENTAMHLVRSSQGVIYIDQLELGICNLCSGFSYCLSLLETFYVWHGSGATSEERLGALGYARSMASDPEGIIELTEGGGDEDEMFWLILGDGEYAKADYWKWKPSIGPLGVRTWLVDASAAQKNLVRRASIEADSDVHDHVYLLDCVLEYFVLVGSEARGRRRDIRLALHIANKLSSTIASARPFRPNVHVIILPSQIPADLRLAFRGLDEAKLNRGAIPDHMNLLSSIEAAAHLEKTSWDKSLLTDDRMLPLGLPNVQ